MADAKHGNVTSLAVWDVPMPAVAGDTFSLRAGAKSASGASLAGAGVEVHDTAGALVASGALGATPLAGSEALYWTALDVRAPADAQVAEYAVRLVAGQDHDPSQARFSVAVAAKPEHALTVTVTERDTKAALEGVEIRLGAFHARTDKSGRAKLQVSKGAYQLQLWRNAHLAPHHPIRIDADVSIELTMVHVPEEHPDARWVR